MKVISGLLKGRIIKGYDIVGTRPTMDRVRESIFGTIQGYIKDSIVLDLFAGSGAYGIEAISNYAKLVYFNDKNTECVKVIRKNLEEFKIKDKAIIYNFDYLKCLKTLKEKDISFDLIFLDPPYRLDVLSSILTYISTCELLNKNGLVIVEFENNILKDNYKDLILKKTKKYGTKIVNIYERIDNEE